VIVRISGILAKCRALQFFRSNEKAIIKSIVIAEGPRSRNRIALFGKIVSHLNNAVCHLSILSKLSTQYTTAPALCNKIKRKKYAGPPTPATTFQGKKSKKKDGSRGENPAGLTARGAWAEAQSTKTMARGARAMGQAPRLTRRSAGAEGLVYRVYFTGHFMQILHNL
jgi:hypothetical protein